MSTAPTSSSPPKVFISYSHKDEKLLEQLEVYLKVLQDRGIILLLDSHRNVAGVDYAKEIEKNLSIAQIVLLLVSVDFLASHYCRMESERAMERYVREKISVIPVILRASNWKDEPFGGLQALPKNGEPIFPSANIDKVFLSVAEGVKKAAERVRPVPVSSVERIEIKLDDLGKGYDQNGFEQRLSVHVAVDLKRITVTIERGCIKIVIEGDGEELERIVDALREPKRRKKILQTTRLKSITYVQDHHVHSLAIKSQSLIEIIKELMRTFPVVGYAVVLAVIAACVTVVAGLNSDYKVAVFGLLTMAVLIFGLIRISGSIDFRFAASANRFRTQPALILTYMLVILIVVVSSCIFAGYFAGRGPLQAYLYPTPSPTLEPSPTQEPQIVVTERPPFDPVGGPASKALIAGNVSGVKPQDYSVVIYSFTNTWYVQPTTAEPLTPIASDGTWRAVVQTGTLYAILLVPLNYQPPPTTGRRPSLLPGVVKWTEIEGEKNQNSR